MLPSPGSKYSKQFFSVVGTRLVVSRAQRFDFRQIVIVGFSVITEVCELSIHEECIARMKYDIITIAPCTATPDT